MKNIIDLKMLIIKRGKKTSINKILIVEDNDYHFMLIREILNDFSVELFRARTGKEALDIISETDDIGLVLLDIKLPGIDGIETAEKIKKINPEIPIIYQTAYAMDGDLRKMADSGCLDYILKPFTVEKLLHTLRKYFIIKPTD